MRGLLEVGLATRGSTNMIRQCAQCKFITGEKEPLEDKSVTHTYCDSCLSDLLEKIKGLFSSMGKNKTDIGYP